MEQKRFYVKEFKEKYEKFSEENEQLSNMYNKYKRDYEECFKIKQNLEKRLRENIDSVLNSEKQISQLSSKLTVAETETEYLRKELSQMKE